MNKTAYENSVCYHLPTMELKRKSILGYLVALQESEGELGAKRMSLHGYFQTELLAKEICFVMGWVEETAGKLHHEPQIVVDYKQFHKARQTILNMEQKGHIKLSKSQKGFKILDVWRS